MKESIMTNKYFGKGLKKHSTMETWYFGQSDTAISS